MPRHIAPTQGSRGWEPLHVAPITLRSYSLNAKLKIAHMQVALTPRQTLESPCGLSVSFGSSFLSPPTSSDWSKLSLIPHVSRRIIHGVYKGTVCLVNVREYVPAEGSDPPGPDCHLSVIIDRRVYWRLAMEHYGTSCTP